MLAHQEGEEKEEWLEEAEGEAQVQAAKHLAYGLHPRRCLVVHAPE